MTTVDNLAAALKMPAGAVVHYIIARWASAGSGALLELGPTMVHRLWAVVEKVEGNRDRRGAPGGLRAAASDDLVLRLPLVREGDSSGY
jgi:hypothetical protein